MSRELSLAEQWVWQEIRSGKVADFNAHFGQRLDPRDPKDWGDERKISSTFLRTVFFEKPYMDAMPPEGVRIAGASLAMDNL